MNGFSFEKVDAVGFLASHVGDNVSDVLKVGEGNWSHAYGYRLGSDEYVIRFSATDEDFTKDLYALNYAGSALHIPKIHEIGEAFGGYYVISDRVYGEFLDEIDSKTFVRVMPSLFSTLDAMRCTYVSSTTGYGHWKADGNGIASTWRDHLISVEDDLPHLRTYGWQAKLKDHPDSLSVFQEGMELLRKLATDCPEDRYLIHSDLMNRNVFITDDRISGVIDWGNAMYGDYVYEVAGFTFWQPWDDRMAGIDFTSAAHEYYRGVGADTSNFEQRVRCYELSIGLIHIAYSAFRWPDSALEWVTERTKVLL
jgi:hygromycin-B 4-O-kinase